MQSLSSLLRRRWHECAVMRSLFENIESINELEEILSKRCCVITQMKEEIKNLTNYHWFKYG